MDKSKNERCLLIMEDEPMLLEILFEACKTLTTNILTAPNGFEGLELLNKTQVHAVLSDINMPKMSGLQVLANIRQDGKETPFIFLTGYNDRESTKKALQLGATDFLEKPYQEEALLASLDLALDLGVALESLEAEMEESLKDSNLTAEQMAQVKNARRKIWKMKTPDELIKRKYRAS